MQEILLKIRYFERGLSKSLKKCNFIFSFELSQMMPKMRMKKFGRMTWIFEFSISKLGYVNFHENLIKKN